MEELLKVENVSVAYDGQPILQNINLSLHSGEIIALVGESGSGKSTLLKSILMLLDQGGSITAGKIIYNGADLTTLPEEKLRRLRGSAIGIIFQDSVSSFCPVRTLEAQIYESIRAHQPGADKDNVRQQALQLLSELNFTNPERVYTSYPFQLSGGMNQRLGIAQAMLLQPRILLADEPTSALDVISQREVLDTLRSLREKHSTAIIIVTHDLGVAAHLADRLVILKDGVIVEQGDTPQLLTQPNAAYTRRLFNAAPKLQRGINHA